MVSIRAAQPADAETIVSLIGQLGYAVSVAAVVERLQRRGQLREVFVATRDGKALGVAAVAVEEPFVTGPSVLIEAFVVDESVRNERIGAELLQRVEGWAREQGFAKIRVLSNVIRDGAHRFYEHNGYARVKTQHNFHKNL